MTSVSSPESSAQKKCHLNNSSPILANVKTVGFLRGTHDKLRLLKNDRNELAGLDEYIQFFHSLCFRSRCFPKQYNCQIIPLLCFTYT